jgi:hypothetical protein
MVRKIFEGFCNELGRDFWHIALMAAVLLGSSAKLSSVDAMWCPDRADARVFVYKNLGVRRSKGRTVVIKNATSCASTNRSGLTCDGQRRFKVVVACWMRQHQRCNGKARSVLLRLAMKWSFQVQVAFSAALVGWTYDRTSR